MKTTSFIHHIKNQLDDKKLRINNQIFFEDVKKIYSNSVSSHLQSGENSEELL